MKLLLIALLPLLAHSFTLTQNSTHYLIRTENYQISLSKQGSQIETRRQDQRILVSSKDAIAIHPFHSPWEKVTQIQHRSSQTNEIVFDLKTNRKTPLTLTILLADQYYTMKIHSPINCREIRITHRISPSGYWYGEGQTVSRIGVIPLLRGNLKQNWPLNRGQIKRKKFHTVDHSGVLTPFWASSKGVGIFIDSYHFFSERFNLHNSDLFSLGMLHHSKTRPNNHEFEMHILIAPTITDLYRFWINKEFIHKKAWNPKNPLPPYEMFEAPIWTTWASYKSKIDQQKVISFAKQINEYGLPYKILEIDDRWQHQYGDIEFDAQRFPQVDKMMAELDTLRFATTLWLPPFVNKNSNAFFILKDGNKSGDSWMLSKKNRTLLTRWWDSMYLAQNAGLYDFTHPDLQSWFIEQLDHLKQQYQLLGFKYDAGEVSYTGEDFDSFGNIHPNQYPDSYIALAHQIHAVEFRSAFFSQHMAPIVREMDKNSTWDDYTGLKSVLTQALSMSIIGYPFVLPDMVGGNKYPFSNLSDELFIRWIELSCFFPMIQLSLPPWEFGAKTMALTRKYLKLHQELVPYIWEQVKHSNQTGDPIIRPLFFEFPTDENTYNMDDQFMLGPKILVAPVLYKKMKMRKIYLPAGKWLDYNNQKVITGPTYLTNYPTPIEIIPFFLRQN